jgi:ABC-type nitrate/sulfonate/bicarbonate transport system substrate-binding protein
MSDTNKRTATLAMGAVAALVACGAVGFWLLRPSAPPLQPLPPVTIAVPQLLNAAPMFVANTQGLFKKAGVDIISQPFAIGLGALKSMLDGKADLALVADTPVMFATLVGADVVILSGISTLPRSMTIVARVDRGIQREQDLVGKSVAITPGTSVPYFLDSVLQTKRISLNAVKRVQLNTDEVISAIQKGEVDAAVVFQPYLAKLQADMGDKIKTFYAEKLFSMRFVLVGKAGYVDNHPQEVQRVLRALLAADASISADPVAARHIVGAALKVDDAMMAKMFDPQDFDVSLKQAQLLALEDQTRWAIAQGLAKPGPVPNYLTLMKYQHLEAVSPDSVQLVR